MPIEVREKFDSRRLTKGQNPSAELAFISQRRSQVDSEHTNSPVSCALRQVSLGPPPENITHGGRSETRLKKLNGARLATPFLSSVEIQPIGRGETSALIGVWRRP